MAGRAISDKEKCIECGICYSICPEIRELDEDTKKLVSWSAPMGCIMGTTVARAIDPEVRSPGDGRRGGDRPAAPFV